MQAPAPVVGQSEARKSSACSAIIEERGVLVACVALTAHQAGSFTWKESAQKFQCADVLWANLLVYEPR